MDTVNLMNASFTGIDCNFNDGEDCCVDRRDIYCVMEVKKFYLSADDRCIDADWGLSFCCASDGVDFSSNMCTTLTGSIFPYQLTVDLYTTAYHNHKHIWMA